MDGGDPRRDDPAQRGQARDPPAPDMAALARDWITLWQSELTALAADRELQEGWATLAALWAGAATAMLNRLPRGGADGRGRDGSAAASPRAAPAAAAPDARDAEIQRLSGCVAELERRLAALERGRDSNPGGAGGAAGR
jgi:hypothetical protein